MNKYMKLFMYSFLLYFIGIALLIVNGFSLGYIIASRYISNCSIQQIALSILPHGVFEIIGLLLAGAIGLIGVKFYLNKNKTKKLIECAKLFFIGISLILIAAIVEGCITPILLKKYI